MHAFIHVNMYATISKMAHACVSVHIRSSIHRIERQTWATELSESMDLVVMHHSTEQKRIQPIYGWHKWPHTYSLGIFHSKLGLLEEHAFFLETLETDSSSKRRFAELTTMLLFIIVIELRCSSNHTLTHTVSFNAMSCPMTSCHILRHT